MTVQQKSTGRAASMPSGLAIGAAVSAAVTIIICGIGAWLVNTEIISQKQIGYCSIMALLTATILGAITAWNKIKRQRLIVCLLSGTVYYSLLVGTTIVFFGGDFQGMGITFMTVMLGCAAGFLMTKGKVKRISHYHRKKTNR